MVILKYPRSLIHFFESLFHTGVTKPLAFPYPRAPPVVFHVVQQIVQLNAFERFIVQLQSY